MYDNLSIFAGETARSVIKENGLKPEMVKVVAGAAGGPKFLVLSQIDRFLFSEWFDSEHSLDFVGSSIGAWRFAALSMKNPLDAYDRLYIAYTSQQYESRPTREEVSSESFKIMQAFLGETGISEIVSSKNRRLNILSVKCRGPISSDNRLILGVGLAGAAFSNVISRKLMGGFFKRALFHFPQQNPPFLNSSEFPIDHIPLSEQNLQQALLSSGSIPFVMSGVFDIDGAPKGTYRDGGLLDYHMDIPYEVGEDSIVLFPHYTNKIIPGWLDKKLSWRKANRDNMKNVLMVCPSDRFVSDLPFGKIPDRNDFYKFEGQDEDRLKYWRAVAEKSKILAEELHQIFNNQAIEGLVKPLPI
jgi:hypothetical protein